MKIEEKFSDREDSRITIENKWGATLTDINGKRYELRENENRDGFEILADDGILNIKPYSSNVVYVSTEK